MCVTEQMAWKPKNVYCPPFLQKVCGRPWVNYTGWHRPTCWKPFLITHTYQTRLSRAEKLNFFLGPYYLYSEFFKAEGCGMWESEDIQSHSTPLGFRDENLFLEKFWFPADHTSWWQKPPQLPESALNPTTGARKHECSGWGGGHTGKWGFRNFPSGSSGVKNPIYSAGHVGLDPC